MERATEPRMHFGPLVEVPSTTQPELSHSEYTRSYSLCQSEKNGCYAIARPAILQMVHIHLDPVNPSNGGLTVGLIYGDRLSTG